jgi:hypothetical protein
MAVAAGAALIAIGAAGLFGRAPRAVPAIPALAAREATGANPNTIGVSGCASAACHGGSAIDSLTGKLSDRTWAGSASHWLAVDPHTKAYAALETPLAATIMERYAPGARATEDARCLACHTNPSLAKADADLRERQLRSEGVSCEACHGDAGRWMPKHTTWTEADRAAGYDATGMVKLFDIGERAVLCAGCHVGAPADESRGYPVRDMNHDMIAAGHPRLNFDFAEYQRWLRPHWQEADRSPEFEVKAWLVGRAAHAEVADKLTKDRESRGRAGEAPWPEFAESSCVSCHHKLGDGFPSVSVKPAPQVIWPGGLDRMKLAAAPCSECVGIADAAFAKVNAATLDRDAASQVYHGVAARERMRMKRDGRTRFDSRYDCLAEMLKRSRGNLDFKLDDSARSELEALLKP